MGSSYFFVGGILREIIGIVNRDTGSLPGFDSCVTCWLVPQGLSHKKTTQIMHGRFFYGWDKRLEIEFQIQFRTGSGSREADIGVVIFICQIFY